MTAIILPTKNESESIGETIDRIRSVCSDRIVVVDGHSTDGTAKIARQMGATAISDKGKGKGMRFGLLLSMWTMTPSSWTSMIRIRSSASLNLSMRSKITTS